MATYHVVPGGAGGATGADKANAFTMEQACDAVAAGDLVHVYGDSGDYVLEYNTGGAKDTVMNILTAGTITSPIVWQGCFDTPGDGGIATIDANTNTLANAGKTTGSLGNVFNVFKNIQYEGATGDGMDFGADDEATFKQCRFTNNGADGIGGDNIINFECCSFDNNSNFGCNLDGNNLFIAPIAYANTNGGLFCDRNATYFAPLAYNNGAAFDIECNGTSILIVINGTVDGENNATVKGIFQDQSTSLAHVVNTIVHDCAVGIQTDGTVGERCIARNNLYNSNASDVSNFLAVSTGDGVGDRGDVSDAPGFTDEANDDYSLTAAAAAKAAGLDAKWTDDFWDSFIAATNPPSP